MWGFADENSRHRGVSAFEDEHPGTGHQPSPAEAGRDTNIIAKVPVLRAFSGSAGGVRGAWGASLGGRGRSGRAPRKAWRHACRVVAKEFAKAPTEPGWRRWGRLATA